jgi:retron-type reverse transcriptase
LPRFSCYRPFSNRRATALSPPSSPRLVTGAQIHAGESIVATFDLTQFFPSVGAPRVHGIFRSLGYPWAVARRLTGLCTTVTPASVRLRLPDPAQTLLGVPHLPQGAATSPALSNLLTFTLDRRLNGLARAVGADYTRYADDLAFSGAPDFARSVSRFSKAVGTITAEEGFSLNRTKTRIMPRHARQPVTGINVNDHCNTPRAEFETLKAILDNCTITGPETQNRSEIASFRAYLEGRIASIRRINPGRAGKLYALFDRINWPPAGSG